MTPCPVIEVISLKFLKPKNSLEDSAKRLKSQSFNSGEMKSPKCDFHWEVGLGSDKLCEQQKSFSVFCRLVESG